LRKRILIKTAGGKAPKKELGMGHIYRAINIAKNLKNQEIFFLVEDFGKSSEIIKRNNFKKITKIKPNIKFENDLEITKKLIQKKKIDIIIIDKFNIKNNFIEEISKIIKTVVISDLKKIQYSGDLVINGFIDFQNQTTYNKYGTKCLLGPKYQILDNKFEKLNEKPKTIDVLATFGGYDEKNILEIFSKEIDKIECRIKVKVILGPETKIKPLILAMKKKYKQNFQVIQKTNDMSLEISKSKYGICSGGITAYEFASLNVPFAIISQVRHQLITAKAMEKRKMGLNLGLINNRTSKKIREFIEKIEKKQQINSKNKIIDGKGASRVCKEILKLK
jgi:spore coat polysaccharide biosynthesis predicted glycosyltransferase SpsG